MSAPAPSVYSPAAKAVAERIGLKMGRANLEQFADSLLELATADRDVVVVTSDSRGSGKLGPFGKALPKQIVEVGIAEQNLVGIAAGLAAAGKKVFAVSPACFLTARALEQIKNDVCYSDVPAKVVGISAGVSYGALGSTHHSLHDLAALRAIHNITILVPGDNFETRAAVESAARATHPTYLRFGKAALYTLHPPNTTFQIGKAIAVRDGDDVCFIGTGETVVHCLLAAEELAEQGLRCRVLSMHTIKPLDREAILAAGRECRAIVTAEEHSVHGGLGEAVRRCVDASWCSSAAANRRHSGRGHGYRQPGRHLPPLRTLDGRPGGNRGGRAEPGGSIGMSGVDIQRERAKCILAIDQSTSATKAVIFDGAGFVVDKASREHRQIYPQPGWVEHDAEELWQNVLAVMRELAGRQSEAVASAACLAITNQRETFVVFEPRKGEPLANAIVWQCRRGDADLSEVGGGRTGKRRPPQNRTQARYLFLRLRKSSGCSRERPELREQLVRGDALCGNDRHLSHLSTHGRPGVRHRSDQRQPHAALRHRQASLGRRALRAV